MANKLENQNKQAPVSGLDENEGEGSRTAARRYNEATQEFVESGRVEESAERAREALSGPEGEELRRAEQEGKARAGAAPKK